MGIETHVLAPDDPRWLHRDDGFRAPSQAWVHRARYLGVSGGKPSEVLAGTQGLERHPSERFRITHTGSFFGRRDPRPFLQALHDSGLDVVARFLGDFRPADREWAEALGLGDRLELLPYSPRAASLALQRDSEALLLLIPEAQGRGRGVLSGKVFEYLAVGRPVLAAVPPDGAAAELIRETGAGIVAAPDDTGAIREALEELHARWRRDELPDVELGEAWRRRLSRRTRVEEMATLLQDVVAG
jgi:glycosyltransferase involved in cell wall biosynthesis